VIDPEGVCSKYADLMNVKNSGGLMYPTQHAFELILIVEEHVIKYIGDGKVALKFTYDSIIESICNDQRMRFKTMGCFFHVDELTAEIIKYYVTNRMFHFEHKENLGSSTKAQNLRKQSKLS